MPPPSRLGRAPRERSAGPAAAAGTFNQASRCGFLPQLASTPVSPILPQAACTASSSLDSTTCTGFCTAVRTRHFTDLMVSHACKAWAATKTADTSAHITDHTNQAHVPIQTVPSGLLLSQPMHVFQLQVSGRWAASQRLGNTPPAAAVTSTDHFSTVSCPAASAPAPTARRRQQGAATSAARIVPAPQCAPRCTCSRRVQSDSIPGEPLSGSSADGYGCVKEGGVNMLASHGALNGCTSCHSQTRATRTPCHPVHLRQTTCASSPSCPTGCDAVCASCPSGCAC